MSDQIVKNDITSLTIVVSTYNRSSSLDDCLNSLSKQTDPDFKILIIDGDSDDNTPRVIAKYSKKLSIRVIVDGIAHLSYIRDLGWRKADTKLVGWIDDDVVVSKGWVKSVKEAFKVKSVAGVSGPTIIPHKLLNNRDVFYFHRSKSFLSTIYFHLFMQGERFGIGKIYPSGAWSPGSNFPQSLKIKPREVDYLEACNFIIRRSVLKVADGFDLKYIGTSEWCEVDLAFRIRKVGRRLLFDPKVAVSHCISTGGVYARRNNVTHRLKNFLMFYLFSYYPKSVIGWFLFMFYLLYILTYYLYLFIKRRI
ncbi:hypothetical protein COW99_00450 [Candidatus Roizmanbacteria bacterium CG22_combo_CG10-13_8_21_14_all_38_20]|uniref:Glycosyltransferase 2-like domain-containing protein n=1 Tax=Candidatus Roizmanbacteria bacterium CG22_combo_CG10-13_8_21_14_all_38_20 TaxID=1974862 RepID=A0A2H0BWZ1_9BACT|nr:MAG: hypothetical protein COW99_00450 [Candidatus Roizmanbacteria bacterium CG22_combo_CG10-13_8_21_14_all_38_20]PJC30783.1 MAG: hypothetical protein CO050_05165 [Candidatus Roizmanbacteria bacterium CG_4_9_14_0_2_um_filter_38_17]